MNWIEQIKSAALVEPLGWTILHSIWQGAVIAVLAGIALRFTRSRSAQLRYLIACAALLLMVIAAGVTYSRVNAAAKRGGDQPLGAMNFAPMHVGNGAPVADVADAKSATPPPSPTFAERIRPILPNLALAWLAGVLLLGAYHAGGWMLIRRLRGQSHAIVDSRCRASLADLIAAMRISRPVQLCESAIIQVPTVIGWLSPVILLPASAIVGLTPLELRGLLAHELAHIRRHDYLVNLIQTIVETLFFYHPAAWWLGKTIRQERENCCDDLAAAMCEPAVYAQALASMESLRQSPQLALSARGGALLPRIRRILGVPASSNRRAIPSGVVSALILVAIIAGGIALNACRTNATKPTTRPAAMSTTQTDDFAMATDPTEKDLIAPTGAYRIGPADVVTITVNDLQAVGTQTTITKRVSKSGAVSMPLIGLVHSAGCTEPELEKLVASKYEAAGYLKEAVVSVTMAEARGRTFSIRGAVAYAGQYAMPTNDFRVLDALALARGTTAPITTIYIIRDDPNSPDGQKRVIRIPLDKLRQGDLHSNIVILPDDLISVMPPVPATQQTQSTASIVQGRITDAATGKPVPNVTIRFYTGLATRALDGMTATDADGRYQFTPIGSMVMAQTVTHQVWDVQVGMQIEHETMCSADGQSWWDVTIPHDARTFTKDFKLVPGGKLFGTVNNKLGQGDANVPLRIYDKDNHFFVYATTDARGQFVSAPLFPGDYVIDVNLPSANYPQLAKAQVRAGENSQIVLHYDPPAAATQTAVIPDHVLYQLLLMQQAQEEQQLQAIKAAGGENNQKYLQLQQLIAQMQKRIDGVQNRLADPNSAVIPATLQPTQPALGDQSPDVTRVQLAQATTQLESAEADLWKAKQELGENHPRIAELQQVVVQRQASLATLMQTYAARNSAAISATQPTSQPTTAKTSNVYYISGVARTGVYSLNRPINLLQAIISAGMDESMRGKTLTVIHRAGDRAQLKMSDVMDGPDGKTPVQPDDILMIAQMSGEYYIGGEVERVGVYSLTGRTINVLQAIVSAGSDPTKIGDYQVELRRRYPTEYVVLQCTVKELVDDSAKRLTLVPNDIVSLALPKATTQPAATQPSTQESELRPVR